MSQESRTPTLETDEWQHLVALDDILAEDALLSVRLQKALAFLAVLFHVEGGAIFMPSAVDGGQITWVSLHLPEDWQRQIETPGSALEHMARQIFETGAFAPTFTPPGLAGGFPFSFQGKVVGGLLLYGSAVAQADLLRWPFYLRSVAQAVAIDSLERERTGLKDSIADLEANRWEIINSRNTLLTFFDSIPASVYIIDSAYTLISVNLRRSKRESKHPTVLVGKRCYEQFYQRIDPCPGCLVLETFQHSVVTNRFNRQWIDQDHFVEWEITTFPIQDREHAPHRVIIFEEDVTEKRNLEANLIQSEKLASVGQLAAGVAHEINNPLAAIIANAQMLKRSLPKDNPDWMDSVDLIEMAGQRASQVVNDLLSLSRKEKKAEFEAISLNETIQNALSLVNHEVVNHGIHIELDLEEDMPEMIASKNHLQGVWINMIVNSIDSFGSAGGHIQISTRYIDSEYRIVIADNGKGISRDDLSRIFEPFFTTKAVGKGTGLGLSVCLRVIKEHQGNISVESQNASGTKFTVIIPNLVRKNEFHPYSSVS